MFDLISLSKHATAAAAALVIAEGAAGGEDPARRQVPEPPAISAPVRERQLVHPTSGPRLVVPRGGAPLLDGRLGEEEWSAGVPVELEAGGHARFLHDGARLYVAIQGPVPGWSHVYLARGDTVRVIHASAALGSVAPTGWPPLADGKRDPTLVRGAPRRQCRSSRRCGRSWSSGSEASGAGG